jgi:hypothetical protein
MTIPTDPRYWDCECDSRYVHSKSKSHCVKCNARAEDQPDSHIFELLTSSRSYKMPNQRSEA